MVKSWHRLTKRTPYLLGGLVKILEVLDTGSKRYASLLRWSHHTSLMRYCSTANRNLADDSALVQVRGAAIVHP